MKITTRALFLAMPALSLMLSSCVGSNYYAKGRDGIGIRTVYIDGTEALISTQKSSISIAPISSGLRSKSEEDFLIVFRNGSTIDRNFSEENVKAQYQNAEGDVFQVQIFSYDQLVKKEKARQAWAALGAGMQAAGDSMAAANAGYSHSYGNYSSTSYSTNSTVKTYGSYSGTTYDYGAANAAQSAATARANANMGKINADGRANLEALSRNILKKQTVPRGGIHGGLVRMKMPSLAKTGALTLTVDIANEKHVLVYDVIKK